MRYLVDEYVGHYGCRVVIILLQEPIRELRISVTPASMTTEQSKYILNKIMHAVNFVDSDPDPWNNDYEQI